MNRAPLVTTASIFVIAVALGACSVETAPGPGKGDTDAAVDGGADMDDAGHAGGDAGARTDAGRTGDAGRRDDGGAGTDAGDDAGTDAGDNASIDAGTDASIDAGTDAGTDAGIDAGIDAGPTCELMASPRIEACLVDDAYAVFVATSGDDANDGTMAEPKRTFAAAITAATDSGRGRVIACGGTYEDGVVVDAAVRVYGGFDCAGGSWSYTGAATSVEPASPGVALRAQGVTGKLLLEDLAFVAADATGAGESSVAAVIVDSDDVTLRDVTLEAGHGMAGTAGTTADFSFPATSACTGDGCLAGHPAVGNSGGAEREYSACPGGGVTRGALGGSNPSSGPLPGDDGLPALGMGAGGAAGTTTACGAGEDGAAGEDGSAGTGADVLGSVVSGEWQPAAGTAGHPGAVGQGGGGGGARQANGGGGGGGAGGCGGAAGKPGQGGGGSIALLSIASSVTLEGGGLTAGDGGNGGAGSDGQPGMSMGGIGGSGASCGGGNGGAGGDGGGAGGGAGGISAAVLHSGDAPALGAETSITLGAPGSGGEGGDAGLSTDDGIAGVAVEALAL